MLLSGLINMIIHLSLDQGREKTLRMCTVATGGVVKMVMAERVDRERTLLGVSPGGSLPG